MQKLDGKMTAQKIQTAIQAEIKQIQQERNCRAPRLDMILLGEDYASEQYVGMKERRARETGIDGQIHRLSGNVSQRDVVDLINQLNNYADVDGFMVQLPMPSHLDTQEILDLIAPNKDVDGLGSTNLGGLMQGADWAIASATAKGVMMLLEEYKINVSGKDVVVLGRSREVGLPLGALLLNADANVTLLHSRSGDDVRKTKCLNADVVISAVGKVNFVTADMIKGRAVVVDIGTNRDKDGKLCGDVDYERVQEKVAFISPVPGGVGPMTIVALLQNVVNAWKKNIGA